MFIINITKKKIIIFHKYYVYVKGNKNKIISYRNTANYYK